MNIYASARLIYSLIFIVITSIGCGDTTMKPSSLPLQTDSISENAWKALSGKKIYFGHMSVGYNIIDGIKDIMKRDPKIQLNIQETADTISFKNGFFAHSRNGRNGDPKSKIDAFVKTMESGTGKQVDIAFFKFCYVDFYENADVKDTFNYYATAMNRLMKKFPNVVFLHTTLPLTTEGELLKDKVKDIIKIIIGKATSVKKNALSNIKRNEFNNNLVQEYGKGSILDIALYESTGPDGRRYVSKNAGVEHASMIPSYTSDGGHLNEVGRLLVADKFLYELAKVR
jgi:hypothetical protein